MTKTADFFDLEDFEHAVLFDDIEHVWESLARIKSYLGNWNFRIDAQVDSRSYLVHPELISIGAGTVVEPGAYIQGPCIIGKNCQIRHGAYIRGDVITGDGVVIGHTTEVKNALFLNGAHAAHFAYVGDSILGNKVNLGAGVKCANFRLDQRNIQVRFEGKKYTTGLRKLGAILGDGSQIGCNSVTNPGTLLKKRTFFEPCSVIPLPRQLV